MRTIALVLIAMCSAPVAFAQTPHVDHLTQAGLIEMAQAMSAKASAGGGAASSKISDYPNHFTMISLRKKSGGAEIHDRFADFFFVLQGSATLLSGGSVQDAKAAGDGETRGSAVIDGQRTELAPGDVVHIPAGVPHQLIVPENVTFTYFVIKVKEK